jgi:hypothetical protein
MTPIYQCPSCFDRTRAVLVRCRKKLNIDSGDPDSKKCKRGCDGAYGGVWGQAMCSVSVHMGQKSGSSHREDVFTFNLLHIETV